MGEFGRRRISGALATDERSLRLPLLRPLSPRRRGSSDLETPDLSALGPGLHRGREGEKNKNPGLAFAGPGFLFRTASKDA